MTKEETHAAVLSILKSEGWNPTSQDPFGRLVENLGITCFEAGYALASNQWVAVDDALPQWRTNVLAAKNTGKGYYPEIVYTGSGSDWPYVGITHFMPLPTAP